MMIILNSFFVFEDNKDNIYHFLHFPFRASVNLIRVHWLRRAKGSCNSLFIPFVPSMRGTLVVSICFERCEKPLLSWLSLLSFISPFRASEEFHSCQFVLFVVLLFVPSLRGTLVFFELAKNVSCP